MKQLAIFDLDGTLLNTIADLGQACNYALHATGFPPHELGSYPFMVGNGITRLIERALPEQSRNEGTIEAVRNVFLNFYDTHCTDLTTPYHGIHDTLRTLTDRGVKVAVASNKYQEAVTKLINHFFPDINWIAIEGQRDSRPTKPNPDIVFDILKTAVIRPDNVLYIGDSGVDIDTARNAGIESIGVTWGFRPEQELIEHKACHIIHNVTEIQSFI